MTNLDLTNPRQLTIALGPDLVLLGGAMLLLIWAAWRPDSAKHQRAVGAVSMLLALLTGATVWWYLLHGFTADAGPIAVENFRWMADLIILVGTTFSIA